MPNMKDLIKALDQAGGGRILMDAERFPFDPFELDSIHTDNPVTVETKIHTHPVGLKAEAYRRLAHFRTAEYNTRIRGEFRLGAIPQFNQHDYVYVQPEHFAGAWTTATTDTAATTNW